MPSVLSSETINLEDGLIDTQEQRGLSVYSCMLCLVAEGQ